MILQKIVPSQRFNGLDSHNTKNGTQENEDGMNFPHFEKKTYNHQHVARWKFELTQRKQDTLLISSTPYVPPIGRA
jgi:hypothetical protein